MVSGQSSSVLALLRVKLNLCLCFSHLLVSWKGTAVSGCRCCGLCLSQPHRQVNSLILYYSQNYHVYVEKVGQNLTKAILQVWKTRIQILILLET